MLRRRVTFKMGGNKSKPFVDVSSKVVSRFRAADLPAEKLIAQTSVRKTIVGVPPYGIRAPTDALETSRDLLEDTAQQKVKVVPAPTMKSYNQSSAQESEVPMDPAILAEISKWSNVKSSPNKQLENSKKERTASMIRFEDDANLEAKGVDGVRVTILPGRMNESQLIEFYTKIRDSPTECNSEILASEFQIPIEVAANLRHIARMPFLMVDEELTHIKNAK